MAQAWIAKRRSGHVERKTGLEPANLTLAIRPDGPASPPGANPYREILRSSRHVCGTKRPRHPEIRVAFGNADLRYYVLRPKRLEIGTDSAEAIFYGGVRGP